MELDDDGKREFDAENNAWRKDTKDLLCLLSAAIYVEHLPWEFRQEHMLNTVDDVIAYAAEEKYRVVIPRRKIGRQTRLRGKASTWN